MKIERPLMHLISFTEVHCFLFNSVAALHCPALKVYCIAYQYRIVTTQLLDTNTTF